MIKIGVFTTTRGDMAMLMPLLHAMKKNNQIKSLLFVGGTHIKKKFGLTIDEIKKSRIKIDGTFSYKTNSFNKEGLVKSLAEAHTSINKIFKEYDFDIVCILGDRFEKLAIVNNAIIYNKPIIHLYGGERSEGVIDEQIRHMITKASHLHFVMSENYKKNIINLGEQKFRVHNVGTLSVDSIKNIKKISYKKILDNIGLDSKKKFTILTYHPVTLKKKVTTINQVKNIFSALKKTDIQVIVTYPGHENESDIIKKYFSQKTIDTKNFVLVKSLGFNRLFNILPYCSFVIGNSSSGITETPYFKIPTINIGERQDGRYCHASVINCGYSKNEIFNAIQRTSKKSFLQTIKKMNYKFGSGNSAIKIIKIIKSIKLNDKFIRKKLPS